MKITLHLTVEEVNAILLGLAELPAKTSMALIQKIHEESTEQVTNTQNNQTFKQNGDSETTQEGIYLADSR
jgi:hypothetical protein